MIVLTTPTGNIGSKVLQAVLETSSEPLRLIARDPAKLPADLPAYVEVISGPTDEPQVLQKALTGADVLFWCQPDTPTAPHYLQAYDDWSKIALDAINNSGVPRVVAITGAGGEPSVPAGPVSGLYRIEHHLSQSSAACRFLRCGSFFSNVLWQWEGISKEGVFAYSVPGDVRSPQVAPEDIARTAARLLLDGAWTGQESISLLGPEDLSYDEVAAEIAAQLQRPVRYEAMDAKSYSDLCLRLGLSPSAAQGMVDMFDYMAMGFHPDPNVDRSLTPTSFGEWLTKYSHVVN